MKTINKIGIFVYYLCVILITILLVSFVFDIVIRRLVVSEEAKQNSMLKTHPKYFYFELIVVWVLLFILSIYAKYQLNEWSKKKVTTFVEKNGENKNYSDLYKEVEYLAKVDIIIIVGFLIVMFGSNSHSVGEKMALINEDIGLFADTFI